MENILLRELPMNRSAVRCVVFFACLISTALSAFVRMPLPWTPVPVTLQTAAVLWAGLCLGARRGAYTQVGYIALGAAGIPVFAGAQAGALFLAGPTAGYIVGFVVAACIVGRLSRDFSGTWISLCALLIIADAALFACGIVWLKILTHASWVQLISMGVIPFIPGEAIKITAVAAVYLRFRSRITSIC
ncbi:MAG TPA: biotin transporter BioY [Candidatus Omnitrophota bacterium]|nr:biotin transporter BioY [Candidatus Omnitrophota bacterium]HPT07087.1 biotin transporter BioY [Candidatus Omnitrophota bacterium]